jgi:preprotein translocase subunit SecY
MLIKNYGLLSENAVGVWWKAVIIILTFAAGSVIIMMMGKLIDEHGIGNGISLILFTGIISRLPTDIIQTVQNVTGGSLRWWIAMLTYLGMIAIVVLIVIMEDTERRIPVNYAKRTVGRKVYSGQSTYLPMKLNMSGVMPIIFAQTIATLPATIAAFLGKTDSYFARTDTWAYIVVYVFMLFFFAFFYSSIQFNTTEVANNLKNHGGTIPGYRPGKPTSELLQSILNRVTFLGALYLSIVVVIPMILMTIFPEISLTGLSLGGTSVIIAVGVALQTMKDLETKLVTRNYSGLFEGKPTEEKKPRTSGRKKVQVISGAAQKRSEA